MAWKIKGKIEGADQVVSALQDLEKKVRKKALRAAVSKAGSIILKRAKQLAPKDSGLLKKSLGRKVKVYPSGVAVAIVGPRKGFRQDATRRKGKWAAVSTIADPTKYGHLVELGTAPHTLKRSGISHPGSSPRSFLRAALDSSQGEIREAMANEIKRVIGG